MAVRRQIRRRVRRARPVVRRTPSPSALAARKEAKRDMSGDGGLMIGGVKDPAEKAADQLAKRVMGMPSAGSIVYRERRAGEGEDKQVRRAVEETDNEEMVKAKSGPNTTPEAAGDSATPASHSASSAIRSMGHGKPLAIAERVFFEPRFNADLSSVRIHDGFAADKASKSINARAFTLGRDIAFAKGERMPGTDKGRCLMAHELAHVTQQKAVVRRSEYEDCDKKQSIAIANSESDARIMLRRAIKLLTAKPVSKSTKKHFANHFGAWAKWRRNIVVGHLKAILKRLASADGEDYECEKKCDGEYGYTYWVFGDIHICPAWYSLSRSRRADTIIHEVQHLRGSVDLGYHERNKDADTYWSVAINNADSFSVLVQDLN